MRYLYRLGAPLHAKPMDNTGGYNPYLEKMLRYVTGNGLYFYFTTNNSLNSFMYLFAEDILK